MAAARKKPPGKYAKTRQKGPVDHKPTAETRSIVNSMITVGMDQTSICERIGITDKTLRKHYRKEINTAHDALVHNSRVQIVNLAKGGDVQCLIYLNRVLGWNDRPAAPAVNLNIGLSLADMDEDAMRAELAEILMPEGAPKRRRRITIDAEAGD
jgi:hypothetical protein